MAYDFHWFNGIEQHKFNFNMSRSNGSLPSIWTQYDWCLGSFGRRIEQNPS